MIKTFGLKKKYEDEQYIFKPLDTKQSQYNISISSDKEVNIQFNLYVKLINKIHITYNNNTNESIKIPDKGILISGRVSEDNPIILDIDILDLCSRIYIKNMLEYDLESNTKISWDKIYIINLERREDRKEKMIEELKKENIKNYEFIKAIDGQDKKIINKFEKIKEKTNIINSGHFACLLSHIKAIKLAKKNNLNSVLILEDDVLFENNFMKKIKHIKINSYDIVYLGGIINKIKLFYNRWAKHNYIIGAYAYIVTKNMYNILLDELKKLDDFVDLCYLKKIQKNYKVFILDDLVKTNLATSDTSRKSKMLVKRLNYINNKNNFLI